MRRSSWFKVITSGLIALAVTGAAWAGLNADVFTGTQLRLADGLFPAAGRDPRIVVVAVDEETLRVMQDRESPWPWDRDIHGRLIDRLNEAGTALVGYDVTFAGPRTGDEALADAIARGGNVVLAANAEFEGRLDPERVPQASRIDRPIGALADPSAGVAHANIIPDPDGVVRALPPVIDTPDFTHMPSMSLALYQLELGLFDLDGPYTTRPDGIQVADRLIPTGDAQLMELNWTEGFPQYRAIDVMEGRVPDDAFRGRIVLVGATALGLGDTRFTPLNKSSGQPGVLVHANALNTMLTGSFLQPDGLGLTLLWILGLTFLTALAVAFLRIWLSPLVTFGLLAGYYFLAFTRFDGGRVMNLIYPLFTVALAFLGALAVRYFTEERERLRVTRVFGRYVAGDVVSEVLAAPERALATLEGASRPISVLFADLRGFTSASDGAAPEKVVIALNAYLDSMTRAVNEELGTIDKFMGDCVMAFWGAPRPTEHHADRAARAAVRMLDYIDEAVEAGKTAGLNVKGCGVGIATGEAVVGNIGSHERLDYTVIGDTVNTASRLCGVAGAGQIVVTDRCANQLGDDFRLAELPPLVVKGKAETLQVFQVLREGQEVERFAEEAQLESTEEKGQFEVPRTKAAGYSPIEPSQPIEQAQPVAGPDDRGQG
jgi:adenylate cyclase